MCAIAAALRRASLAVGLLAIEVAAFVPGGLLHAPHVHMPHAVAGLPGASRGGARVPLPGGRARLHTMSATTEAETPTFERRPEDSVPRPVPIEVLSVLRAWADDAAAAKEKSAGSNDTKTQQVMQDTLSTLLRMRRTISEDIPQHVFALSTGEGIDDIQAIATVADQVYLASNQEVGGMMHVVDIHEIVAKPAAEQRVSILELIRMIDNWAGERSVTISQSDEVKGYYTSLGFDMKDMAWSNMVYRARGLEEPSRGGKLHMLELQLDTGPAPTHAIMHSALRASAVINEWARDAAAAEATSAGNGDEETRAALQGTQRVLRQMHRTIAEDGPVRVFALTTGEGAADVQALATVADQVYLAEEDDVGGTMKVLDVRELVASPGADGRQNLAELLRRIRGWADGRSVIISRSEDVQGYYRSLGFDPGSARRGRGTSEQSGVEHSHMITLELGADVEPRPVPLEAGAVIHGWARDAAQARDVLSNRETVESRAGHDGEAQRVLSSTEAVLYQMHRTIAEDAAGTPRYVLALTDGLVDIQAIATVTTARDAATIHEIVAKPAAEAAREGVAELLRRIRAWAVFPVSLPESGVLRDYFDALGLEPDAADGKGGGTEPSNGGTLQLVALELGADLAPLPVPLRASSVIYAWASDAARAVAKTRVGHDAEARHVLRGTQSALYLMHRTLAEGRPQHVFALTTGADSIQALATVTTQAAGGAEEAVGIREVVARPTAEARGGAAELLVRRIRAWAAGRSVAVSHSEEIDGYYQSLGFEPDAAASGHTKAEPSTGEKKYRLLSLELGADPLAPLHVPWRAGAVISEWMKDAAAAGAGPGEGGGGEAGRLARGTRGALFRMHRTIDEGAPQHVFALTTGAGGIQAIATVLTEDGGKGEGAVDIREVVAKPSADARRGVAELVRWIRAWAAGRSVTVSPPGEVEGYFEGLGLEPGTVGGGHGGADMPSEREFQVVALELDSAPMALPVQASAVMNEWAKDAAKAFSLALGSGDSEAQAAMQGTQNVLLHMYRTMAEGAPRHIFALTAGVEPDGIQAIATVGASADSGAPVDVLELVARPAAERRQVAAELVRRIQHWAEGRPVRISDDAAVGSYYKSLGFDRPSDLASPDGADGPVGPPSAGGLAMVALEHAAEPARV